MKYHCQRRLDEHPDCPTWENCHTTGICLKTPLVSGGLDLVPISLAEFACLQNGTTVLFLEHGEWKLTKKAKRHGYLGAVKGFWLLPSASIFSETQAKPQAELEELPPPPEGK